MHKVQSHTVMSAQLPPLETYQLSLKLLFSFGALITCVLISLFW